MSVLVCKHPLVNFREHAKASAILNPFLPMPMHLAEVVHQPEFTGVHKSQILQRICAHNCEGANQFPSKRPEQGGSADGIPREFPAVHA